MCQQEETGRGEECPGKISLQTNFSLILKLRSDETMFTEKPVKDVDLILEQIVPSPTKDKSRMIVLSP